MRDSGTYTAPTNVRYIEVTMIGGGRDSTIIMTHKPTLLKRLLKFFRSAPKDLQKNVVRVRAKTAKKVTKTAKRPRRKL